MISNLRHILSSGKHLQYGFCKENLTVTFEKSFWRKTKWTFRAKSMCTSFHQNELHLQAMIESLRLSLWDRLLCSSVVPTPLYNHPFLCRTFHPRSRQDSLPWVTSLIGENYHRERYYYWLLVFYSINIAIFRQFYLALVIIAISSWLSSM